LQSDKLYFKSRHTSPNLAIQSKMKRIKLHFAKVSPVQWKSHDSSCI